MPKQFIGPFVNFPLKLSKMVSCVMSFIFALLISIHLCIIFNTTTLTASSVTLRNKNRLLNLIITQSIANKST